MPSRRRWWRGSSFFRRELSGDATVNTDLAGVGQRILRGTFWSERIRRQFDLRRIVHVPIFLRRVERQLRLEQTDREEERLLLFIEFAHRGDAQIGDCSIGVGVVGNVGHFRRGPASRSAERGSRQSLFLRFGVLGANRLFVVLGDVAVATLRLASRFAPGRSVVVAAVKDLDHADGVISVRLEVLTDRDHIRHMRAEMRDEVKHFGRIGPQSGHQTGPRRRANRLLAVGSQKSRTATGQPVNVWAFDMLRTVATQLRPQVVHGDELHVGPLRRDAAEREAENRQHQKHNHRSSHGNLFRHRVVSVTCPLFVPLWFKVSKHSGTNDTENANSVSHLANGLSVSSSHST